jgi:hypothetical protein
MKVTLIDRLCYRRGCCPGVYRSSNHHRYSPARADARQGVIAAWEGLRVTQTELVEHGRPMIPISGSAKMLNVSRALLAPGAWG